MAKAAFIFYVDRKYPTFFRATRNIYKDWIPLVLFEFMITHWTLKSWTFMVVSMHFQFITPDSGSNF